MVGFGWLRVVMGGNGVVIAGVGWFLVCPSNAQVLPKYCLKNSQLLQM